MVICDNQIKRTWQRKIRFIFLCIFSSSSKRWAEVFYHERIHLKYKDTYLVAVLYYNYKINIYNIYNKEYWQERRSQEEVGRPEDRSTFKVQGETELSFRLIPSLTQSHTKPSNKTVREEVILALEGISLKDNSVYPVHTVVLLLNQ